MSRAPTLRVHLLGAFRVLVGDQLVPPRAWRSERATAILKLLALTPGHRLHRERLMETLWPDLEMDAQANNLNVATSRARQALGAAGAPRGMFLIREGDRLVLGPPGAVWIDVDIFERLVAAGWRSDDPAVFRSSLMFYPGDLLPDDLYEEWTQRHRTALQASYLALLSRLGQLHTERGEFSYAIEAYQRLLISEPAHEEAHVAVMQLSARCGQRTRALDQYDQLVSHLARDVDAAPDPETTALAQAIRDGRYPGQVECATQENRQTAATFTSPLPNLPATPNDIIGREREIAEVRQMLLTGQLVTLTGPGGIGKTRLSIAVAKAVLEAFADGVFFVDLSSIRDPDLVLQSIAKALDVREQAGQTLSDGIASYLRNRQLLLVLDNFEQVVEAAPAVASLLERAPQARAIITSRTIVRLRGEREYRVPWLELPDPEYLTADTPVSDAPAVALFIQRAREAKPSFALTTSNTPAVAEICRRLNGLPLAIELAAARVRMLAPEAILQRLEHPLALLTGGAQDVPRRQQTMRATIQWSHDLLTDEEQRLFRLLSLFADGWTLEAAEEVSRLAGEPGSILDILSSLADKNLVTQREHPDGFVRFGMLETIREYALERLVDTGRAAEVRDHHAAYFVALAEQAKPHLEMGDQADWLNVLEREDGNLRVAMQWLRDRGSVELGLRMVSALGVYWFIRGRLAEGCDQTLSITSLPQSTEFPALCIDALNAAAMLARESSEHTDYERSYQIARRSLALSHQIHDRKRAADAMANLGYVTLQWGKFDDARDLFQRCLTTNRELRNQQGIADALSFLALTAYYGDDLETARMLNEESLALWSALDDRNATVWARTRLGTVLLRQGVYDAAYDAFMGSLLTSEQLGFRWGISWSLDGLAALSVIHQSPHLALRLAATAASVRDTAGVVLPPREQADTEELRSRINAMIGAGAEDAWRNQQPCSLDELVQMTRDNLCDLRPGTTQ